MASPVKDAKDHHESGGFGEVAGRGRGWLRSRKPGTNSYALTTQVGDRGWHFGSAPFDEAHEVDSDWVIGDSAPYRRRMVLADYNAYAGLDDLLNFDVGQVVQYVDPGSGESVSFQPQQLQWTNDLDQIDAIGDPGDVGAVVDGDVLRWNGAFGSGLDFEWETQTSKLAKKLIIQNSGAIGSPPQFIIDGGNPVLNLQFIFQRSSGVRAWVDGVEFDELNNSELSTAGDIEFRLESTGEVVWYFAAPLVWDGDGLMESGSVMRLRATALNLFVSVRVPLTWLESAAYPVTVDPTIDPQVGASGDDGERYSSTTFSITNNSTELGDFIGRNNRSFSNFSSVTITASATIDTAYMSYRAYGTDTDDDVIVKICAVDASAPSTPTTYGEYDALSESTENTNWTCPSFTSGSWYNSDSIVDVIQELVNSYSYASGSNILILEKNNGSTADAYRQISHYDHSSTYAPKLHIEYTEAVQILSPISDISAGTWEPSTGSDLYAMIDEETYSDSDYIESGENPSSDVCEVRFESGGDPLSSANHKISYRIKKDGAGTINLTFYLMEGATQRATWSENDISATITAGSHTLSSGEADSITDYGNLRLRMSASEV